MHSNNSLLHCCARCPPLPYAAHPRTACAPAACLPAACTGATGLPHAAPPCLHGIWAGGKEYHACAALRWLPRSTRSSAASHICVNSGELQQLPPGVDSALLCASYYTLLFTSCLTTSSYTYLHLYLPPCSYKEEGGRETRRAACHTAPDCLPVPY